MAGCSHSGYKHGQSGYCGNVIALVLTVSSAAQQRVLQVRGRSYYGCGAPAWSLCTGWFIMTRMVFCHSTTSSYASPMEKEWLTSGWTTSSSCA